MKLLGIIAEYNPFHNGHLYHIEESLKQTGCDAAVVVMSGDFVQRGSPAILSKHLRAKMALTCGASVVLELPVWYACGSAECFAAGAVALLNSLGCIHTLSFGSEHGNLTELQQIAEILLDEPDKYKSLLQQYLSRGYSYPSARKKAFQDFTKNPDLYDILDTPNNILGIEYLKSLYRTGSSIRPFTLSRKGAAYHTEELHETLSSASAIRASLLRKNKQTTSWEQEECLSQMPASAAQLMLDNYNQKTPVCRNDFSLLLKSKLLTETCDSLIKYTDISEALSHKIINSRNQFMNWEQFCELLKTKELTHSRISRALLHILLDIRAEDMTAYQSEQNCCYARVLGFRKEQAKILKLFKQHSSVPIITKLGQNHGLSETGQKMLDTDCHASNLYESVITDKFQTTFWEEHSKSLILYDTKV